MKRYTYAGKVFDTPDLTATDIAFTVERPMSCAVATCPRQWRVLCSINTIWSLKQFAYSRLPIPCGNAICLDGYAGPRILDMPIKMPGTGYRLPAEIAGLLDDIKCVARTEAMVNPFVDEYHAYLTVETVIAKAGTTARSGGAHVDGFQGARVSPKLEIDHSYLAVTDLPTLFYPQGFRCDHLNPASDNFFTYFDTCKDHARAFRIERGLFYLIDAYTVHEAAIADRDVSRTFFRLTYSVRQYDRLGNTHNQCFDYDWKMVPRDWRFVRVPDDHATVILAATGGGG